VVVIAVKGIQWKPADTAFAEEDCVGGLGRNAVGRRRARRRMRSQSKNIDFPDQMLVYADNTMERTRRTNPRLSANQKKKTPQPDSLDNRAAFSVS